MRRLLIGAGVLAVIVAVLAVLVGNGFQPVSDLDHAVGRTLHFSGGGSAGVELLSVLTAPGLMVFRVALLVPVALVLAVRGHLRVMGFVLLAALTVSPLTTLLKELVGRVRPTFDDPLVGASGLSFPSGHSSGAAALFGVLLVVLLPLVGHSWRPWLAGAAIVGAIVVAWTRLALGVHYLSDTVAGLALGAAVVLVCMAIFGIYPGGRAQLPERGWPVQHPERRSASAERRD